MSSAPPVDQSSQKVYFVTGFLAIIVIGAILRLTLLGAESFWFDEAWTWTIIRGTPGEMITRLSRVDAHPPLYFLLIQLWSSFFGTEEVPMRLFSALISVAAIPLMYRFVAEIGGRRAGIIATIFLAMSPYQVWYAKEARSYSLLFLLCLVSTLFFFAALRSPTRRNWICWALSAAGIMYTHYMGGFYLLAQLAAAWSLRRERESFPREFAWASVLALLFFSPWLPFLFFHVKYIAYDFWMAPISPLQVFFAFCDLVANPGTLLTEWGHVLSIPFLVFAIRYATKQKRPVETALLWLLLFPGIAQAVLSVLWKPIFSAPTFQFMLIPLFTLTALAVAQLAPPRPGLVTAVLAMLLFPSLHHMQNSLHKEDWRGITKYIDDHIEAGEVLIVDPGYVAMNLEYYGEDLPWREKIVRVGHSDSIRKPVLRNYAEREILPHVPGVWLIFRYGRHLDWPKKIEQDFEWKECLVSRYVAAHHYRRR